MTLHCLFLRGRCDLVRSDMLVLRPQMFACQIKVLKCAC